MEPELSILWTARLCEATELSASWTAVFCGATELSISWTMKTFDNKPRGSGQGGMKTPEEGSHVTRSIKKLQWPEQVMEADTKEGHSKRKGQVIRVSCSNLAERTETLDGKKETVINS